MKALKIPSLLIMAVMLGASSPLTNQMSDVVSSDSVAYIQSDNANSTATAFATASSTQTVSLSQAEKDGLVFMREEEKLAYDVYMALSQKWDLNIFQNISHSELTHTNEVKALLDLYQIADPVASAPAGKLANPELQSLYSQLISQGSQSLADALKVGAAIEEIDIQDLKQYMLRTTDEKIRQVYENLLLGSYNHLRAFVFNLQKQTGEAYSPQYLSVEEYQFILNSPTGTDGGQGRCGAGGSSK